MKKINLIIAVVVVGVIVLTTVLLKNWLQDIPYATARDAQFTALQSDAGGVDISSAFQLSFVTDVSSASVRKFLAVAPEIELGVHQGTKSSEVLIAPAEPLQEGTIYTFTLAAEGKSVTWAVQTKTPLAIEQARPADRSGGISLNSSIDIVLNQMTPLDLDSVAQSITITPATAGSFSQNGRVLSFKPDHELAPGTVYQVKIAAGLATAGSNLTLAEDFGFAFETAAAELPTWRLSGEAAFGSVSNPAFLIMPAAAENEAGGSPAEEITVQASIYRYAAMEDYAAALSRIMTDYPCWSRGYQYLGGTSLNHTTLYREETLSLNDSESGYPLVWPETLPEGYYLLRCHYDGEARDLLFAISAIDAYLLSDQNQTLLWLHDTADQKALSAEISWGEGQTATSGEDGLALLQRQGDTLYTIRAGGHTLVLPCHQPEAPPEDNDANWRYLYLDQATYQRGDTLNYWGMVKPRDGSELDYERVTVQITAAGGDIIYKGNAPLTGDLFSGNIVLPSLLDGIYRLEIWQSGRQLIAREFSVGETETTAAAATDAAWQATANDSMPQLDQADGYLPGESFTITSANPGRTDYLYLEAEQGIRKAVAVSESTYDGVFAPENDLNSYAACVSYGAGGYEPESPALLYLDSGGRELQIAVSGSLMGERSGDAGSLQIAVRNADHHPLQAALCLSIVEGETKPDIDTKAAIYGDYTPSGITSGQEKAVAAEQGSGSPGTCLFFTVLATDEQGTAECSYQLPRFSGTCWLIVQAVNSEAGEEVRAGSVVLDYGEGSAETETEEADNPQPPKFAYESGRLAVDKVFREQTAVAIFSAADRLQMIGLLLDALTAYREAGDAASAEQAFAAAHARQLLLDYASDRIASLAGAPLSLYAYQRADGGLGDAGDESQLALSVKAIAAAPEDIDYAALLRYYRSYLEAPGSRLEQIMSLAGLALYRQPVLNDVQTLLSAADLSDEEYLWLLLALHACGDQQRAAALLDARLAASAATLNAQATALSAWLAAACGRDDALDWLSRATEENSPMYLEQVLVARLMLPRLSAPEMSLTYTLAGDKNTARIGGINDCILTASPEAELIINGIEGEIHYLSIFRQD